MERQLARHLNAVLIGVIVISAIGAVVLEFRGGTISRWVRKTDDIQGDARSLAEAMTSSRMGAIEMSMMEFHRNPIVGSGFQVAYYTQDDFVAAGGGLMLSASIEKGIVFTMVLGETGLVGIAAFMFFLVFLYYKCAKNKHFVVMTTFTALLATNLGEATFFSPSGCGGVLWTICVVGGFTLDMIVKRDGSRCCIFVTRQHLMA